MNATGRCAGAVAFGSLHSDAGTTAVAEHIVHIGKGVDASRPKCHWHFAARCTPGAWMSRTGSFAEVWKREGVTAAKHSGGSA